VVHGVVLAIVRLEWDAWIPPVVTVPVTPHVEVVDISVQPLHTIDVAMLDDTPAVTAPVRAAGSRMSQHHAAASAAGTANISTGGAVAPERGRGTDTGKGMFKMRGPELHPGDAAMEHIADAPGHVPSAVIPSKRLEDAGGGSVIHDAVTTITVDRDGTAHLHDKPDGDIHISTNPLAIITDIKDAGKVIADWAEDPEAGTRYGRTQDLSRANQASPGGCTWGDPMCDDPEAPEADKAARRRGGLGQGTIVGFAGKADITAYLMRKFVGDPFSSRKLKALDDTRLERAERGAKYKTEQLGKASQIMQENLQRVWSGTTDVDERKVVVFELWDECVEGEGPIGEAGEKARAMVIGWIRAYLPDGKPGAFSAEELDLLDRRRTSKQHFAPY